MSFCFFVLSFKHVVKKELALKVSLLKKQALAVRIIILHYVEFYCKSIPIVADGINKKVFSVLKEILYFEKTDTSTDY
jgi:hypothetical protein